MSKLHTHRVTADSVAGRRMAQAKGSRLASDSRDPEIRAHNEAIEKARQEKLAAKKAKRAWMGRK